MISSIKFSSVKPESFKAPDYWQIEFDVKNLYSNKGTGEKISLYEAQDDFGESRYIAKKIENLRINKLSIDTSEVIVEGEINNLGYSDKELDKKSGGGFIGKIL